MPTFVEVVAPTDDELHALLQTAIARLMEMLTRRGVLIEEMVQTSLAEPDVDGEEVRTLRPLQAAAVTYRIAFGPRAGRLILRDEGGGRFLGCVGRAPRERAALRKSIWRSDGLQWVVKRPPTYRPTADTRSRRAQRHAMAPLLATFRQRLREATSARVNRSTQNRAAHCISAASTPHGAG